MIYFTVIISYSLISEFIDNFYCTSFINYEAATANNIISTKKHEIRF